MTITIWLNTIPNWINMSYGGMLVIGYLVTFSVGVSIYNYVKTGDSGFF